MPVNTNFSANGKCYSSMTIAILTLLLANLDAYSTPIDSADADYCIDLDSELPMIVFEKKNKDLKPISLNTQEPLKCRSYHLDTTADFEFTPGRNTCDDFYMLAKLSGTEPEIDELPSLIQLDYPKSETISFVKGRRKKEELLLFKNKIINATVDLSIQCYLSPGIALEFSIPFRARITDECP